MKTKQTAQQKAKTDKAYHGTKLKVALPKTAVIIIRASATVKQDMMDTAKRLGMSLTDYLTRLHELAKANLK